MSNDGIGASSRTIRVAVAEDHELTRMGLVYGLRRIPGMLVNAEAESGREICEIVRQSAPGETPDIILMDIGLPVMDGIEATQTIKQEFPAIKILMLTSHTEERQVLAAMAAGADAYCAKDIRMDRLMSAIDMVLDGGVWLDPAIAGIVLNAMNQKMPLAGERETIAANPMMSGPQKAGASELTDREMEVLAHIVDGKANKEIASAMNLSVYTVKSHVCNIIQKLSVDDRTQAAVKALKEGLL